MPTLVTNQIAHAREDLANTISNVDPTETPFFSSIGKTKATAVRHEVLVDSLSPASANNAVAEGADLVDTAATVPVRVSNICQLMQKDIRLSGTIQAVDTAGAKTEKARLVKNRGLEIRRDLEMSLLGGQGSSATGTRYMGGYQAITATNAFGGANSAITGFSNGNISAAVDGTARSVTEAMFLDMLEKIYVSGGRPKEVLAGPKLKRAISGFTGGAQKQQNAEKKTINQGVDIYVSDWGTLNVNPHPYALTKTIIAYDPEMWAVAFLRSFSVEELGKSGDSDKFMIVAEATLEAKNEKSSGQLRDLNA
ncbi:DUF5309 family protein [Neorhizobium sp. NCHU2750]|uniref:SU10 major capsid protein n=1 Tax=Neorhizobium sp. NCHU2750 TaxID=1825976 RepID=UPI000E724B94|nr:hypothetical protein NCHU2750_23510 [Neorhizobium sp. NCHU2750]